LLCCELLLNLILSSMVWSWTARVLQEFFFICLSLSFYLCELLVLGLFFLGWVGSGALIISEAQQFGSHFHCSNNSEAFLCIIRCVHEYEKWLQTLNMICFSPDIALYIQKENSESMYHVLLNMIFSLQMHFAFHKETLCLGTLILYSVPLFLFMSCCWCCYETQHTVKELIWVLNFSFSNCPIDSVDPEVFVAEFRLYLV
jgi:hypothetical protein